MKKRLLTAVLLAATLSQPGYSQSQQPVATTEAVATAEPIPVPEEAPQGSSTPTAVGVGAGVLVAVVLVGLTIFAVGISSLGSGS